MPTTIPRDVAQGRFSPRNRSYGATSGVTSLRDSLARSRPLEARLGVLQRRHETQVGSTEREKNRLRSGAGSAVQQKFQAVGGKNRFTGNLEQTLRRSKARSGVVRRGDKAIANQQLKDRVSIARQKIQKKGLLEGALGDAAKLKAGGEAASLRARDTVGNAYAGAAGAILGGFASGFKDMFKGTGGVVPVETDMGTASADFQIGTNFDFNINNVGSVPGGVGYV